LVPPQPARPTPGWLWWPALQSENAREVLIPPQPQRDDRRGGRENERRTAAEELHPYQPTHGCYWLGSCCRGTHRRQQAHACPSLDRQPGGICCAAVSCARLLPLRLLLCVGGAYPESATSSLTCGEPMGGGPPRAARACLCSPPGHPTSRE